MVLGHYGIALAAKRWAPQASLGTLVLAAQLADEIWPLLLLLGVERVEIKQAGPPTLHLIFLSYPITHSLLTEVVGGALLGLVYFLFRKDPRGAVVAALLVPSHWILDFLVHVPDLPIWPGGPKVGLGLWRSVVVTVVLETCFFLGGLLVYLRSTSATDRIGSVALWGFVILLVGGYASSLLGPAPPDVNTLAWSAVILWLLVPWAYWINAHRRTVAAP